MQSLYETFLSERGDLTRMLSPQTSRHGDQYGDFVNFSSNDVLGLSAHPAMMDGAMKWMKKYGASFAASRLVSGDVDEIHALEARLAQFKNTEAALIMTSGFQANASLIAALVPKDALVFSDRLNHASLQLGFQAASVKQIRYRHLDIDHLEEKLVLHHDNPAPKFIITESVFSMDGDLVDLDRLVKLKEKYNAFLYLDEAHSFGVMGENGAGLSAAYGGRIDLVMSTFGKAAGGFGAFIACSKILKDYIVNTCAGFIYATALPPQVFGTIEAALDILPTMNQARKDVAELAAYFRENVQNMRFDTAASQTHVVPVILGEVEDAVAFSQALLDKGIYARAIRPPTVPAGTSRVRFSFMATHQKKDVDQILDVLKEFHGKPRS